MPAPRPCAFTMSKNDSFRQRGVRTKRAHGACALLRHHNLFDKTLSRYHRQEIALRLRLVCQGWIFPDIDWYW